MLKQKNVFARAVLALFVFLYSGLSFQAMANVKGMKSGVDAAGRYVHRAAGNPYLPLWEHLPDGEPRVFEDPDNPGKYRAYIIGSHDLRFTSYCGPDIRMWSAPRSEERRVG